MELFLWAAGIYLVIGFFKGTGHLNSGRVGAWGPWATILAFTFLWPILAKKSNDR